MLEPQNEASEGDTQKCFASKLSCSFSPHETECSGIRPVGVVKTDQSSLLWGMVSIYGKRASCMPPCSSVASQSKPENGSEGDVLLIFRY